MRWGVEPICQVLSEHGVQIAPSTYYEWRDKLPSKREQRDEALLVEIRRVHEAHFGVYGARKVWLQLNREGIPVARCTVERLMRGAGLEGARRGKVKRTTIAGPAAERPDDLVSRRFAPLAPNRLFKTELIKPRAPWKGVDEVEFATAEWVDWFNHRRLYKYCGDIPPAELEQAYYAGHSQPHEELELSHH